MLFLYINFYLFKRKRKRDYDRDLSSTGLLPNAHNSPGLGSEAGSQKLNPGLPSEWQEPSSLSCHLLSPMAHIHGKLELGEELGLKPRSPDMGYEPLKWCLNH